MIYNNITSQKLKILGLAINFKYLIKVYHVEGKRLKLINKQWDNNTK